MERPNHLQLQKKTAANKATSLAIVAAIHVIAIGGLVAALNQGEIMQQLKDIQATVEQDKTPPKAPPPPPPDLVKPPPPVSRAHSWRHEASRATPMPLAIRAAMAKPTTGPLSIPPT